MGTAAAALIQAGSNVLFSEFTVKESVEVTANSLNLNVAEGPTRFEIDGAEIGQLGSVMAGDPIRSLHALPGVSANDDFNAQFAVHSAPFRRVGIYLDGVLLQAPFHSIEIEGSSGGSTSVFGGGLVGSETVETGAFSPKYPDRTAAVVDIDTREGSRSRTIFRANASASSASLTGEGPFGGKGSWLASARKSYLQYIVGRTAIDEPSLVFGFVDEEARLTYDFTPRNRLSLSVIDGTSDLDRSRWKDRLGLNAAMMANDRFTLANLGWTWAQSDRFVVTNRTAFLRERTGSSNPLGGPLGGNSYQELVGTSDATLLWSPQAPLEFGVTERQVRGALFCDTWLTRTAAVRDSEARGEFLRSGGFVQQGFAVLGGRVRFSAGGRWDQALGTTVFSPQASVAFLPFDTRTRLSFSWGQYAQWPSIEALSLRPERAIHYVAALEHRIGNSGRLRVEAWDRQDRDLVFRSLYDPRLTPMGLVFANNYRDSFRNSMRGWARGVEVLVQRRTAKRLTGWASYSLSWAKSRDAGNWFWSDHDQRHAANVYLGYRLKPSITLGTRTSYGSGSPVPAYLNTVGPLTLGGTDNFRLDSVRNALRLPAYERTDIRMDKAWNWERWKLTLYTEVQNALNRRNVRFDSFDGYDGTTGRSWVSINRMLPVLPVAGLMFEF